MKNCLNNNHYFEVIAKISPNQFKHSLRGQVRLHTLQCCLAMEMERRHSEVTPQLFERSMEERVNDFKADWIVATTVPPLCKIFSHFYYENTGPP